MRLLALFAIAVGLCYAQRTDGSFERTLSVTGFADLELTTDAGGIYVVPGPPGTIRIRGILKAENNWFSVSAPWKISPPSSPNWRSRSSGERICRPTTLAAKPGAYSSTVAIMRSATSSR